MNKINCMDIYNRLAEDIRTDISNMGISPTLNIYKGEDDYGSNKYVALKKLTGDEVGIKVHIENIKDVENAWKYDTLAQALRENAHIINGIYIAQLPMHEDDLMRLRQDGGADADYIVNYGFTLSKIFRSQTYGIQLPATVKAVIAVIEQEFPDGISGKKVAVVGCRSKTVGVYLHPVLTNMNATVTTYHSKSTIRDGEFEDCDIVISSVGYCGGIKQKHFGGNTGCVCIDIGVSKNDEGKTIGDFDVDIREKQRYTPYINGIGLLTRIFLMQSVVHEFLFSGVDYLDENYEWQSPGFVMKNRYAQRKGYQNYREYERAMSVQKQETIRPRLLGEFFGTPTGDIPYTRAGQL